MPGAAAGYRSAMQCIDGVRALVTGGTSGLGRALAQALVQGGARVVVTDRDVDRTRAAADELGAVAVACDVTDEHAVNRGVAQAYSRLGGLDLLVNNAGIGMRTVNPAFMTGRNRSTRCRRQASGPSSPPTSRATSWWPGPWSRGCWPQVPAGSSTSP